MRSIFPNYFLSPRFTRNSRSPEVDYTPLTTFDMSLNENEKDDDYKGNSHNHVSIRQVDEAAALAGSGGEVDPAEASRVRRKIDRHILPLMCGEFVYKIGLRDRALTTQFSTLLGAVHGQGKESGQRQIVTCGSRAADHPGLFGYSRNTRGYTS